jgi:hypothetical protein
MADALIKVNPNIDSRKGKGVGWITILKLFNESERAREREREREREQTEILQNRGGA